MKDKQAYINRALKDAEHNDWETPHDLFAALWDKHGGFDLDPCGQKEVHYSAWRIVQRGGRCFDGSTEKLDGLVQPWGTGKVFCNPPYSEGLDKWIAVINAEMAKKKGPRLVVALLPARTGVKWFHQYIYKRPGEFSSYGKIEIDFLPGRLKFVGAENSAPFSSMIVTWSR